MIFADGLFYQRWIKSFARQSSYVYERTFKYEYSLPNKSVTVKLQCNENTVEYRVLNIW